MKLPKHIYILLILSIAFFACSDTIEEPLDTIDQNELSFEQQIMAIPNNSFENTNLILAYSEVMKEVLALSADSEFRNLVFESTQVANENDEDYVMELSTMTKKLKASSKFGKSAIQINSLVSKIQNINAEEVPMIFYPKAETIEDNLIANKGYDVAKNLNEPIAVLKGAYNDDYSAPGYKLKNGKLVFDRMVTEEDAWNNDVYVIGKAEKMSPSSKRCENMQKGDCYGGGGGSGGSGSGSSNLRTDGRAEYGGLIQLTDLNEIEHWFSGKLEFQIIVAGVKGSAATVIKNRKFPKVKRKHFKDEKWYDYNDFIANWNKTNLGEWNIEKWIERDGGKSSSVTLTLPGQAATSTSPATPTYSVNIPSEDRDDDLGTSIVQFSDKLSQEYSISFMKFKRK